MSSCQRVQRSLKEAWNLKWKEDTGAVDEIGRGLSKTDQKIGPRERNTTRTCASTIDARNKERITRAPRTCLPSSPSPRSGCTRAGCLIGLRWILSLPTTLQSHSSLSTHRLFSSPFTTLLNSTHLVTVSTLQATKQQHNHF